jgi:hypothetical protein
LKVRACSASAGNTAHEGMENTRRINAPKDN